MPSERGARLFERTRGVAAVPGAGSRVADRPDFETTPPPDIKVDFFCIGTPKSRSTWLARCVAEHPQICVSIPKETNFFARRTTLYVEETPARFLCGWDWYRDCFNHAQPGQIRGDFSINLYRNAPEAPRLLREAFPDAKLVVALRDPVKRLYSHYWHRATNPAAPPLEKPPEVALLEEEFLSTSRYHQHLRPWAEEFPRERLHIVLDTDFNDPRSGLAGVYRFLGVRDDFAPPSLERVVQPIVRQRRLQQPAARLATLLRQVGVGRMVDAVNRSGLKRWLWEGAGRQPSYPPLSPELAEQIYERLADDMDALEDWLGRDLSAWRVHAQRGG